MLNTQSSQLHHCDFLNSLSAGERKALTTKSNKAAFFRLAIHLLSIIFCGLWIHTRWPLWQLFLPLQGIMLVTLFHLCHECSHGTAFHSRRANKVVAFGCGFVLLLPATWFRYFHFAHHRYTQDAERDPELAEAKPVTRLQWIVHVSGLRIWWASLQLLFSVFPAQRQDDFIPQGQRSWVSLEIRVMTLSYMLIVLLSVVSGSAALVWLWILPLILGQPFLRLYLLAEHADCPLSTNMLENTRTVFTNPIVRWLTWNMPYHTEHHVYPAVPFHRLPDLHRRMHTYLACTKQGYVDFNADYYRGLS